ncbi:hypothetical protein FFE93_001545 [Yersinia sp. KBS0713]|nr:hypothetical protein FFE93_001545 [Yersinia sp. KBS0713]
MISIPVPTAEFVEYERSSWRYSLLLNFVGLNRALYPKLLELQVGSKRAHPDELTLVSDSGK